MKQIMAHGEHFPFEVVKSGQSDGAYARTLLNLLADEAGKQRPTLDAATEKKLRRALDLLEQHLKPFKEMDKAERIRALADAFADSDDGVSLPAEFMENPDGQSRHEALLERVEARLLGKELKAKREKEFEAALAELQAAYAAPEEKDRRPRFRARDSAYLDACAESAANYAARNPHKK